MRSKIKLVAILFAALFQVLITSAVIGQAPKARPRKQTESWRKQAPEPKVPGRFNPPAAHESKLDNGLTLVLVEDHRSPIVTILIGVPLEMPSGNIEHLTNQIALAEATAELITEGAGSRTSEQVDREVETMGGRLSSSANDDYAEVAVSVVAENAERMMELLGDVLLRPTYPDGEVALHKRNRIQTLVVQRQDPAFLVEEQFDRIVFGAHPYAISAPTPASIDSLDREKIVDFYKSNFGPQGSVAVIAGDFNIGRMQRKAHEIFSEWKGAQKEPTKSRQSIEIPRSTARRVYLINRPGSEQADFRIGAAAVRRGDQDYFALLVANAVLGSGTNSRLFLNIRERKGYAYDVFTSVSARRQGGTFHGGAETRTAVTVPAIKEMLAEFDRLHNAKVPPQELQSAKNYLNGLFSLALSTQGGVAERILQTYMLDLGRNYLETYRAHIEAVTAEQVQQAARKYILTDIPAVVVVGDASKLAKPLKAIAPVKLLDIEGKPAKQPDP